MLRSKWVLGGLIALAALPPATWSLASGTYVLGDSIGDGLATTMGFNNLAQIGIHIRGPKALAQIARTPPGSTAYIFLGTNDAEGSLKNIDKSIDDILDAAAQRQLTVVWVGPHCVRKAWDKQASELDEILRNHLAKASVNFRQIYRHAGLRPSARENSRARRRASHREGLPLYVGHDRQRGRHVEHGRRQRAAKAERRCETGGRQSHDGIARAAAGAGPRRPSAGHGNPCSRCAVGAAGVDPESKLA